MQYIETESGIDSASSPSDPDEDNDFPPVVKDAYNSHFKYTIQAFRASYHVISGIRDGTLNRKTYDEIPVLPKRGEYTLYSPQYVQLHYKKNPTLWTEQFAETWTAGSIRLGPRWKIGGELTGARCTIPGVKHLITFGYSESRRFVLRSTIVQADDNGIYWYKHPISTTMVSFDGPYIMFTIPAEELGGSTEEEDYLFVGILDRTEEDMETNGFVKDYWSRPVPYYEAPFMSTLPQGRTR